MEIPTDRWLKFLAEPEKLFTMQKFDISVYPNLLKATELLDRSNFTVEQQIAYDRHWFAVADINQTRIDSFDRGYDEGREIGEELGLKKGREEGKVEGREEGFDLTLNLIEEIEQGVLSNEQLAEKYSKPLAVIEKLAQKFKS